MRSILITGASGTVGNALVPLSLAVGDKVKLILRAKSPEHLKQRLLDLWRFWELEGNEGLDQIEVFAGDVSKPRLGLQDEDYARLAGEVTHLIHAAGNVRLNQSLEDARRTAVEGTHNVLELIKNCQATGKFTKLDFVSTVGVAGKTAGRILERPCHAPGFHNTYEQAKAEAEVSLLKEIERGLPATIHRPSMVIGDSKSGKIKNFQVFYHLCDFFCGLRTGGVIPDTGKLKLDVVPADYVAKALWLASGDPSTVGKIFHLASGPEDSWNMSEYTDTLRRMLMARGATLPDLKLLSLLDFRAWCGAAEKSASENKRFLAGLPFLLDYLEEEQSFDNSTANDYFSGRGLDLPRLEEYLPVVMNAYWKEQQR